MFVRKNEVVNMIVQIPNSVQPPHALPVVLTMSTAIMVGEQIVGHPQQHQQYIIPSEVTPELLHALNASFAVIGHKLVPLSEE